MIPFMTSDDGKDKIHLKVCTFQNAFIEVCMTFKEVEGTSDESGTSMLRIRKKLREQEEVIMKQRVYLDEAKKQNSETFNAKSKLEMQLKLKDEQLDKYQQEKLKNKKGLL